MNGSGNTLLEPAPAPAHPSRYGWIIIVCSALAMLGTMPGRTQGLGLITEPMLEDLQIDHLAYAQINLWATLIGAAFCLPIGRLIDRFGVRRTTVVMLLATGMVTWWLSRLAGGYAWLFLAITLTRGFGQSALSVCSITSVGKWYSRHSGPAMAAYAILIGIFFVMAFVAVPADIRARGWRAAWEAVAASLIFVIAPLTWLFLRDGPPVKTESKTGTEKHAAKTADFTLSEALKTPTFWIFAGATSFFGLAYSGLSLLGESILAERGFDQKAFHTFLAISMGIGLLAQLGVGWLATRVSLGPITGCTMLLYAIGLAMINFTGSKAMLYATAAILGAAGSGVTVVFFAVWSRAFGPLHLGRIQGAAQLLTVVASAMGPVLFAQCTEKFGAYSPVLWCMVPLILLLGLAAWRIPLPPPPPLSQH